MRILRITHFRWGDTINNWYSLEQLKSQMEWERAHPKPPSKDITGTDWYKVEPVNLEEILKDNV